MSTHALAAKYEPVPDVLRDRLLGDDYPVPDFGLAESSSMKGYRIALLTTHGPELPEFDIPLNYLRDRGAQVDVVTQDWLFDFQPEAPGKIFLAQWLAVNVCVQADKKVSDARIDDYDALITIGGAWNPILLRTDGAMKHFIRGAQARGLLIASICHGPQLLISSEAFPRGTKATAVTDVRIDLANAGFRLLAGRGNAEDYDVEHPVVYDDGQRLITSPNPKALQRFCEEIGVRLLERAPVAASR